MTKRLSRLLALEAYLASQTYPSVDVLTDALNVSKRTVYLDIKELKQEFRRDIRFHRRHGGYYLASMPEPLPHPSLTQDDLALLVVALHSFFAVTGRSVRGLLTETASSLAGAPFAAVEQRLRHFVGASNELSLKHEEVLIQIIHAHLRSLGLLVEFCSGGRLVVSSVQRMTLTPAGWVVVAIGPEQREILLNLNEIERCAPVLRDSPPRPLQFWSMS